jgi:hypothetical protein
MRVGVRMGPVGTVDRHFLGPSCAADPSETDVPRPPHIQTFSVAGQASLPTSVFKMEAACTFETSETPHTHTVQGLSVSTDALRKPKSH